MTRSPDNHPLPAYYPIFIDLCAQPCLVAGGGTVARRKIDGLLAAGACVTVVAPRCDALPPGVILRQRPVTPDDLAGMVFVIAATDDPAVNASLAQAARARGIWVNVVDAPEAGTVILPAVVTRGALRLAISTGGASPVLAQHIRTILDAQFGAEYAELVDILGTLRREWEPKARATGISGAARRRAWEAVLALPLLDLCRAGDLAGAACAATAVLEAALAAQE